MTKTPKTYALGGETPVNRLGYGAMRLTGQPGNFGPYPDWEGGLALLRRAADVTPGLALDIEFADGHVEAQADPRGVSGRKKSPSNASRRKPDEKQGSLL